MIGNYVRPSPPKSVTVEYDSRGERKLKTFSDIYIARRFYVAKDKAGKNPLIKSAK